MLITSKVLAKPKTILVQLASMAGTGTKLLHIRDRVAPKTVLLRFDKAGLQQLIVLHLLNFLFLILKR